MEPREIRQWCMFIHLSLLAGFVIPFAGIVLPIVLWQIKKDEDPSIDVHGRIAINGMISFLIYLVAAGALAFVMVGILLLPLVGLAAIAMPIIGAVKANNGVPWRYPLTFQFV